MADVDEKGNLSERQVQAVRRWMIVQRAIGAWMDESDKAQADPDLPTIDMDELDDLESTGLTCPRCGKQEFPNGRALLDGFGSFAIDMPGGLELDNEEGDPKAITWETGCCGLPFRPVFVQHTLCRVHGLASSVPGYPNQCSICNQDGAIRPKYKEE
jgi:hypothetical protein